MDAINSLTEDVLEAEKAERRKREVVANLLEEAQKIAEEEEAAEEVYSRKKRDIISVLLNESA